MPDTQTKPDSQSKSETAPKPAKTADGGTRVPDPVTPRGPAGDSALVDDDFQGRRSLSRLRIVTGIGRSDLAQPGAAPAAAVVEEAARAMVTQIDLVAGDLTTAIDPEFADDPDHPVAALHRQNVETAWAQVAGNAELALDVLDRLAEAVENRAAALGALAGMPAGGRRGGD